MKINKNQGQSLSSVGIYLPRPLFTLWQLYVIVSRDTNKKWLKILIHNEKQVPFKEIVNAVHKEVFQNFKLNVF